MITSGSNSAAHLSATPLDVLADELGAVAGRVEREMRQGIDALRAEIRADREALRADREVLNAFQFKLENRVQERVASLRDGDAGPQGEKGDTGLIGERGADGLPGERGDPGERGENGIPGERGEKGETGERGAEGAHGEKGERGDAGPQGEKGDNGEPGKPGLDGASGAQGDKGEDGPPGRDGNDGTSITVADVEPMIAEAVERQFAKIPVPKDGKDGRDGADITDMLIDQNKELRAVLSTGITKNLGVVVGRDGKDAETATAVLPELDDEVCKSVASALRLLAERPDGLKAAEQLAPVINLTIDRGVSKKTITTRRAKDGNLVGEILES